MSGIMYISISTVIPENSFLGANYLWVLPWKTFSMLEELLLRGRKTMQKVLPDV